MRIDWRTNLCIEMTREEAVILRRVLYCSTPALDDDEAVDLKARLEAGLNQHLYTPRENYA